MLALQKIAVAAVLTVAIGTGVAVADSSAMTEQTISLDGHAVGSRFDGIGVVDGGGATSVLLKDYPEPQRSQILDLVYRPKFGASVSALYLEIPGDGNSTQGSMPSHMHTRDDLNYQRGYMWWVAQEAKKRNQNLTLDGTAWSAPGWIGGNTATCFKGSHGDAAFWSPDTIDYYLKWLQGLRKVYGLEMDAIGCRNEKGVSYEFAEQMRAMLDRNGFEKVKLHAFDNWPHEWGLDFVKDMTTDSQLCKAVNIVSAHMISTSPEQKAVLAQKGKPYWNTEEHVYKEGFDCEIGIVKAFNENFIERGATKIVNWYGIAGLYPMQPYSKTPSMLLAWSPWSGHYVVREALWGYAHYGQFTQVGWRYLNHGCGKLLGGGSFVTMKSPDADYSIILETKSAKTMQQVRFQVSSDLQDKSLCVWFSDAKEQFVRRTDILPENGEFAITLQPDSIYSLSTTRGQQKGAFDNIPKVTPFPFPYHETFDEYSEPSQYGYLPHYTADIDGSFELVKRPDGKGQCLRQVVPVRPISWAPDWQPYTILGDDHWEDYEISADVYLNAGDSAGVMARVNEVGTGYGCIPKGYYLQLTHDGQCQLIVVRGKQDKKKTVGDAEQQAIIKAQNDDSAGGEAVLGVVQLANISHNQWHKLNLRCQGPVITGLVDGDLVLIATNMLYASGMAGLMAGADGKKFTTPYYDNLMIKGINAHAPKPTASLRGQLPIYRR